MRPKTILDLASDEGVNIFELRFGPSNYMKHLKLHEIVEPTLDGIKAAARDFNMHTGLIICGIRTNLEAAKIAAEIAVNYQDRGVVGYDLAGKENGHRPKLFQDIITPVLDNFLPVTIHAGEADTVGSIAEAMIYLNAQRIGHAVTLREGTKLMKYMDSTRSGLEICMTSNLDTGAVASFQTHPVRDYFKYGLRTSFCTDNRLISDTTVTDEMVIAMNELGFTQDDIFRCVKHGIKSAFMSSCEMKQYLDRFDAYVASLKHEQNTAGAEQTSKTYEVRGVHTHPLEHGA